MSGTPPPDPPQSVDQQQKRPPSVLSQDLFDVHEEVDACATEPFIDKDDIYIEPPIISIPATPFPQPFSYLPATSYPGLTLWMSLLAGIQLNCYGLMSVFYWWYLTGMMFNLFLLFIAGILFKSWVPITLTVAGDISLFIYTRGDGGSTDWTLLVEQLAFLMFTSLSYLAYGLFLYKQPDHTPAPQSLHENITESQARSRLASLQQHLAQQSPALLRWYQRWFTIESVKILEIVFAYTFGYTIANLTVVGCVWALAGKSLIWPSVLLSILLVINFPATIGMILAIQRKYSRVISSIAVYLFVSGCLLGGGYAFYTFLLREGHAGRQEIFFHVRLYAFVFISIFSSVLAFLLAHRYKREVETQARSMSIIQD